jgi:hypothetical protein
MYTFADWKEGGKGLLRKAVQGLVGGLATRGGTAIVLNAKGGREMLVFSKAGMKVLASFSGVFSDSKSGRVYEAKRMKAPQPQT